MRGLAALGLVICFGAAGRVQAQDTVAIAGDGGVYQDAERKAFYQPAAVINHPNEYEYTRVTEFKYLTGQSHSKTSVVYEFPRAEGDPYYPVPRPENAVLYKKYQALAEATPNVHFVGRLATYKYYNMDQVVAQALTVFSKIAGVPRAECIGA